MASDQTTHFAELQNMSELLSQAHQMSEGEVQVLYDSARKTGWKLIKRYPKDKQPYRLLSEIESTYRNWQTLRLSYTLEAKSPGLMRQKIDSIQADFQNKKHQIYAFAVQYMPQWGGAWYMLGDLDELLGRCQQAKQHYLTGVQQGEDANSVEYCFYSYLASSSLAPLTSLQAIGACRLPEDMHISDGIQLIEMDWNALELLIPKLEKYELFKALEECRFVELSRQRLNANWMVLQTFLDPTLLPQFTTIYLWKLATPMLMSKGFSQPEAAHVLGLETVLLDSNVVTQLKLDVASQHVFLHLNEPQKVSKLEERLLQSDNLPLRRTLYQSRLLSGDFDGALDSFNREMESHKEKLRVARQTYETNWRLYTTTHDRMKMMQDIIGDWTNDMEARRSWYALADRAWSELYAVHWILETYYDDLFAIDLIRRVAGLHQPWFGRFLLTQPELQTWLEKADLDELFRQNHQFIEIHIWLQESHTQSSNWGSLNKMMSRIAKQLEQGFVNRSGGTELFPSIGLMIGQHVWRWLDDDSQLFLHEAEIRHRREMLIGKHEQDFSGIYAFYHKALEVTLSKALIEPFGKIKPKSEQLWALNKKLKNSICPKLPKAALPWADLLSCRLEVIQKARNQSMHRYSLHYDDYLRLRHLVLGTRYRGQRTVSILWLVYAIEHLLTETTISEEA